MALLLMLKLESALQQHFGIFRHSLNVTVSENILMNFFFNKMTKLTFQEVLTDLKFLDLQYRF